MALIPVAPRPLRLLPPRSFQNNPDCLVIAGDPVVAGLSDSQRTPGNTVHYHPWCWSQTIELLKETIPKLSRVAVF
jgi:hypothetical protein